MTETASGTSRQQSIVSPLVSIIVNNYNYERFVAEAIDSALSQTYRRVEVIVVDDGSTDNSRQVIESRGNQIRTIFKANGGQGSAFNRGFEASTGDLILFLDADDVLEPGAIETIVREWRDGLARIYFPLQIIDEKGKPRGGVVGGANLPSPLSGPFGIGSPTSGNVFSRTALDEIMPIPEEDWRISADLYLNAASLFGEVRHVAQPLGKYRVHGSNNIACAAPLAEVRSRIHLDLRLYEALCRLTDGKVGSLENWLGTCPRHWIRRMKSLRESSDDHPWPDTLLRLTVRAIKASWREPEQAFHRRLAYTLFVMAYGLSPRKTGPVFRKALRTIDGRERGRTIKLLLGA